MLENKDSILGYGMYILDEFEFESGKVLQDVVVEYTIVGTPKYDDDGNISNAIVYCHNFNGNYSSIDDEYQFTCEGGPFDKNDYCFISISSLGFPGSCSPSTTGLKHNFPEYTLKDRVNFKRQFLAEKLNMHHVHGITGTGSGGYEVYTWACEYPDEMDFIMVGNTSFKTNGYRYVISKAIDSIIESTDGFYDEIYSESLSRVMVSIYRLVYSNYFSKKIFQKMSNDEIDVLMDDFVDDGLFTDIYDFKYRNDCVLNYDIEDKLENIKVKVLVVISNENMYYIPKYDSFPIEKLVENSKVISYESQRDYAHNEDYSSVIDDISEFLDEFKN
ncbi:MAG: homoserine acetyltransferase [Methanobrevibacter sp.]|uniref:homoserine acetyltransferase n=1 Tax=Methanobrevibacter sp. TaxID=66852 RepID=UPI0025EFE92E|nr:homoserine acetyltransferase [Methanobrevibacter sp.]MBQ6098886.1 homoserine acetyltransferase [Methanobrevibacter sp.]